ncbi:response regulator transcription factor [Microbacterium terrisoli]|uniref:response regulator transcription factor n=1 Tax=Microbacterium terrisoli TaxID=3242192 RepID=UPI00351D5886
MIPQSRVPSRSAHYGPERAPALRCWHAGSERGPAGCNGLRGNPEIAAHLYIGVATVKTHVNAIFAKLGVRTRPQAIALVRS